MAQTCTLLPQPQLLNTEQRNDIIYIGAIPWRPYSVILPNPAPEDLANIRLCVTDAYRSQSRLGVFIQVGSFATRSEAEAVNRQLVEAGYSTRITHRRGVSSF